MWNEKCCKKCRYMRNPPNEDLKICILRCIEITNINAYCKEFEEMVKF